MNPLEKIYRDFKEIRTEQTCKDKLDAMQFLIESLVILNSEDIYSFLKENEKQDILGLPFWFTSLSYKLIVLNNPKNKLYIQDAIINLEMFGGVNVQFEIEKYKRLLTNK